MDISTTVSALSMLAASGMLFITVYTNHRNLIRGKQQATLDAFNTLQEQALDILNDYPTDEIVRIAQDKHSEEYKTVSRLMARIEHFSVGICRNIYDFDTLYALSHGYFEETVYDKILPMLERKDQDGAASDTFYHNYKAVVKRMKEKGEQ